MVGYWLGVDLGTTYTSAAVRIDGRVDVVRLGGRHAEIPSEVFIEPDGAMLVGEAAQRRGVAEPLRLVREFKRRVGDPVPAVRRRNAVPGARVDGPIARTRGDHGDQPAR